MFQFSQGIRMNGPLLPTSNNSHSELTEARAHHNVAQTNGGATEEGTGAVGTSQTATHPKVTENHSTDHKNLENTGWSNPGLSSKKIVPSCENVHPNSNLHGEKARVLTIQRPTSLGQSDQFLRQENQQQQGQGFSTTERESEICIKSTNSVILGTREREQICSSDTKMSIAEKDKNEPQKNQDSNNLNGTQATSTSSKDTKQVSSPSQNTVESAKARSENTKRPCLKRGDSCFIKRPDSRTKSVTFFRPASVDNIFESCQHIKDEEPGILPSKSGGLDKVESVDESVDSNQEETQEVKGSKETNDIVERFAKTPVTSGTRPSSSGPAFKARSRTFEFLNRANLQRRKSFYLDRQGLDTDTIASGINLPKSGAFLIRRESVLNNKSCSSYGLVSQPPKPQGDEKNISDSNLFETYVICNGKLIRRSSSFRFGSAGSMGGGVEGRRGSKSGNVDYRSTKHYQHVEEDRPLSGNYREYRDQRRGSSPSPITQWNYGDPQTSKEYLDNYGDPSTSGSSCNTQPATRPGGAVADSTGAVRHWSSIKQCLISGPPSPMPEVKTTGILLPKPLPVHPDELEIPEDMEKDLEMLGFRKGKRKKSKKGASKTTSAEGETQKTVINLKEDPMFQKVIKKNRNVAKFATKPEPRPNAVCFEIPGISLSHQDVKFQLEKLLATCPEVTLNSVQFEHRSLVNNCNEMDNRWIITTNSVTGRNRLAGNNLNFCGQVVQLRRYDDVINSEYQQFVRMSNFIKMMNSRNILGSR